VLLLCVLYGNREHFPSLKSLLPRRLDTPERGYLLPEMRSMGLMFFALSLLKLAQ